MYLPYRGSYYFDIFHPHTYFPNTQERWTGYIPAIDDNLNKRHRHSGHHMATSTLHTNHKRCIFQTHRNDGQNTSQPSTTASTSDIDKRLNKRHRQATQQRLNKRHRHSGHHMATSTLQTVTWSNERNPETKSYKRNPTNENPTNEILQTKSYKRKSYKRNPTNEILNRQPFILHDT